MTLITYNYIQIYLPLLVYDLTVLADLVCKPGRGKFIVFVFSFSIDLYRSIVADGIFIGLFITGLRFKPE